MAATLVACTEKRKRTPSVRLEEMKETPVHDRPASSLSLSAPLGGKEQRQRTKKVKEEEEDRKMNSEDEFFPMGGIFDDEAGLSNIVLEDQEFSYDGVEWYSSHLDPRVILWSSHPEVLPPTVQIKLRNLAVDLKPGVGNMFLVQAPPEISNDISQWTAQLDAAADAIRSADALLIIAGAGMGVDSGLPDYRGPNGFWTAYPMLQQLGISMEEMSATKWFLQDPLFAWGFYAHRTQLYAAATPHEGFSALLDILKQSKFGESNEYFVFTSNIDSQFQKAGFDSGRIFECHGSLQQLQCAKAVRKNKKCTTTVWPLQPEAVPEVDNSSLRCKNVKALPRCVQCGGIARPNVSMFGDTDEIFVDSRAHKQKRALVRWLRELQGKEIAVLELGCGTSMHSLRIEADALLQRRKRTTLIRVNPGDYRNDMELSTNPPESSLPNAKSPFIGIGLGAKATLLALKQRLVLHKNPSN